MQPRTLAFATLRASALAGLLTAAALPSVWAQVAAPTFTCSGATNAAAGVYAPADVGTVLNTRAASPTDRGNQPRWAWAEPAAYVGGQSVATAPAVVPSGLSYTAFTGNETSGYAASGWPYIYRDRVGFLGKSGSQANTIRFVRYSFNLAADVDPATLQLTLSGLSADDALAAVYMNGQRWTSWSGTVATPVQPNSPAGESITLAGNGAAQWQAGGNEVVFALYDSVPGGTSMAVLNSAMACTSLPPAAAVPTLGWPGLLALSAGLAAVAAVAGQWRRRRARG